MHDESTAAGRGDRFNEVGQFVIAVPVIDPDSVLDGDHLAGSASHRRHALCDQGGFGHQTGAKATGLHPVGRAADVEVDLVVAPFLRQPRASGQVARIAAAELQGQRVLIGMVVEKPCRIAMQQRARGDHLGVENDMAADLAQEVTAVSVRPIQHRRNAEAVVRHRLKNIR